MTMRTILTTTAIATATLLAVPAFAGPDGYVKSKAEVKTEMSTPAAKAPLQQQKAEDLYQRAEQLDEAGMRGEAMDKAVQGLKMEIAAETNVEKAEMMSGEELILRTEGETMDPLLGENATALVKADATKTVIVPMTSTVKTEREITTTVTCPAGTEIQPDSTCMIVGDYKM